MHLSRSERRGINGAAVLRAWMQHTGKTPAGHWLWTEEEVATLRAFHPDYRALVTALPRRTREAIEKKAAQLGIARRRKVWAEAEVVGFKAPYTEGVPVPSIVSGLVQKTPKQVYGKAASKRYRRPLRRPKPVPWQLVDSVRQRAFDLRISLRELDDATGRGRYFAAPTRLDLKRVRLALPILGGTFAVRWRS